MLHARVQQLPLAVQGRQLAGNRPRPRVLNQLVQNGHHDLRFVFVGLGILVAHLPAIHTGCQLSHLGLQAGNLQILAEIRRWERHVGCRSEGEQGRLRPARWSGAHLEGRGHGDQAQERTKSSWGHLQAEHVFDLQESRDDPALGPKRLSGSMQ
eukprot:scaffold2626_cov279-Pinguiococcus_pyrenoidosus.AAC.3